MGKCLHNVFSTIVKDISQELTNFGESGSELSHFIPEPRNFAEVKKLSKNIRKPWLKAIPKDIKNLINLQHDQYLHTLSNQHPYPMASACL